VAAGSADAGFTKRRPGAPPGFFAAEARGLAWLAEAGAPVPEVRSVGPEHITVAWIEQGPWTAAAEEAAGRAVAALHLAGAPCFGMPGDEPAFIGDLPMDNTPEPDWPTFWAERRVRPLVRDLVDRGELPADDAGAFDRVCERLPALAGPAEPPARLHGDLWTGNLVCDTAGRPWLIDPAAHGGHRETDLAMLALFGGRSERFVAAYAEVAPPADGWREREPLHQLHPLLVHALLFGGSYGRRAVAIARRFG
jgi:fructosamine-3-kinase